MLFFSTKQKMATLLGTSFSTNENTVAQVDVQLLRKMVESLVIEFDQEKFEKFLSSGPLSPRQCDSTTKSLLGLALNLFRDFSQSGLHHCSQCKLCHF